MKALRYLAIVLLYIPACSFLKSAGEGGTGRKPATHTAAWIANHGPDARRGWERCMICHKERDCADCHKGFGKLKSPHPEDFDVTHSYIAASSLRSCKGCHKLERCGECHVKEKVKPSSHSSGWTFAHGSEARRNMDLCVLCHDESRCVSCHRSINPHPPGFKGLVSSKGSIQHRDPSSCANCHVIGRKGDEGVPNNLCGSRYCHVR
jgi:hypothetical protein